MKLYELRMSNENERYLMLLFLYTFNNQSEQLINHLHTGEALCLTPSYFCQLLGFPQ